MNPLTQVKNTQKITAREAALGISDTGSWHAKYKDSAYIYAGGFSFELTEGDLLAVFAQYGEIVDLNLVRNKETGKSRGFAFLAYEDQRSTVLAVDNLNGANIMGRIIKVDHVADYKKKEEENEEEEQRKREERGVCRAFQRGQCNRGSSCKFSHNEERCANTGWGSKDDGTRWRHDKYASSGQEASRDGMSRPRERERNDGSDRDGRRRWKDREKTEHSDSRRDGGSRLKEKQRSDYADGRGDEGTRLKERTGKDQSDTTRDERSRFREQETTGGEMGNLIRKSASARSTKKDNGKDLDEGKHRGHRWSDDDQHGSKAKAKGDTEKHHKSTRYDSDNDKEDAGYSQSRERDADKRVNRNVPLDDRDLKRIRR